MVHEDKIASKVFDNRRRGEPMMGCDCMQCFGYCLINRETEYREISMKAEHLSSRFTFKTFEFHGSRVEGVDVAIRQVYDA